MHDGIQCDPIQGQGHEPFKFGNPSIFKRYLLRHNRARFLIFILVFVSCDFELGRNVSCEESTDSPARANLFVVTINEVKNFDVLIKSIFRLNILK